MCNSREAFQNGSSSSVDRARGHSKPSIYYLFQAEAYMTLREWGKAERLLRNVLETDSERKAVALYQLSQVLAT